MKKKYPLWVRLLLVPIKLLLLFPVVWIIMFLEMAGEEELSGRVLDNTLFLFTTLD